MAAKLIKKGNWQTRLMVTFLIGAAALFLPTSLLLTVGMLPTLIMLLFDRTPEKSRMLTVGSMNLAGCMPFIMELWQRQHTVDMALSYLTQPRTIVVMYFAAGIGYMIEWIVTGLVASMAVQKAKSRITSVKRRQEDLEKRWGREVSGQIPLDDEGFPLEPSAHK